MVSVRQVQNQHGIRRMYWLRGVSVEPETHELWYQFGRIVRMVSHVPAGYVCIKEGQL